MGLLFNKPCCCFHSALAQATITSCRRLGGFNNKHAFLLVPQSGSSEVKVPVDSMPGEGPLPGLQMAVLLLCPQWWRTERGN